MINNEPSLSPRKLSSHPEWWFPDFSQEPDFPDLLVSPAHNPPFSRSQQGGAQISLAEVCRSGERSTRWYNLLSYKYLKKQSREPKPGGAWAPTPGPESTVSRATTYTCGTWMDGRNGLSQNWREEGRGGQGGRQGRRDLCKGPVPPSATFSFPVVPSPPVLGLKCCNLSIENLNS